MHPAVRIQPDDIMLVSYPRSGNTWARFLLAALLTPGEPVDFDAIDRVVPSLYVDPAVWAPPADRPRILKSHEPVSPDHGRTIMLVRDPRAVAVSYFHQQIRRERWSLADGLDRFVEAFVAGDVGFGAWDAHVSGWLDARGGPGLLLVRYEDLVADTRGQLAAMARFAGLDPTPQDLDRAVQAGSLEAMQAAEVARRIQLGRPKKHQAFVRGAMTDGWRRELSPQSAQRIEHAFGDVMRRLGYAPSRTPATDPAPLSP